MTELIFTVALIAALFLSLMAVVVGIWVNPRPGLPKWMLAASSVFLFFGIAGFSVIMIIEFSSYLQWIPEETLWNATFICLTLTAILFATGFLWDRIRRLSDQEP